MSKICFFFFFSSRRRHTRFSRDWSSDVCSSDLPGIREHVTSSDVVTFLASVGSLALTFLAGAEIDPVSLRGHWKASLSIGVVSFAGPFAAAFGFCSLVLGWNLHAAEIGGIALST